MNEPRNSPPDELMELAEPYALHALDADGTHAVDAALESASPEIRASFQARVREVRETMAAHADGYPERPSPEVFDRVVGHIVSAPTPALRAPAPRASSPRTRAPRSRRRLQLLAAAAVLVVAVAAGVVLGRVTSPDGTPPRGPEAAAVLAAPDARTARARLGDATISFVYSRRYNSGVVLMNDVPPPKADTVYQMWLMDPGGGARSRGTMTQSDVRPTTTASVASIDGATSFGISVEAPGGAQSPSPDRIVATIPLGP